MYIAIRISFHLIPKLVKIGSKMHVSGSKTPAWIEIKNSVEFWKNMKSNTFYFILKLWWIEHRAPNVIQSTISIKFKKEHKFPLQFPVLFPIVCVGVHLDAVQLRSDWSNQVNKYPACKISHVCLKQRYETLTNVPEIDHKIGWIKGILFFFVSETSLI